MARGGQLTLQRCEERLNFLKLREKQREREREKGGGCKGRPDPSVPALAQWDGSGTRRGGKRGEPAVFDGRVKTGRSPCDPVSVVSSAAARAKWEILAYTR